MTGGASKKAKRSQSDFNMNLAPKFGAGEAKKKELMSGILEEDENATEDAEGFEGVNPN
jgi:hypothetical protein